MPEVLHYTTISQILMRPGKDKNSLFRYVSWSKPAATAEMVFGPNERVLSRRYAPLSCLQARRNWLCQDETDAYAGISVYRAHLLIEIFGLLLGYPYLSHLHHFGDEDVFAGCWASGRAIR